MRLAAMLKGLMAFLRLVGEALERAAYRTDDVTEVRMD